MVMDYLRSCYKRRMRFVRGDPDTFAPVTWYFCAPTAVPFPGVHRFGSANWDSTRNLATDLGDDAQRRPTYYNGRILNRSDGKTFAGPRSAFESGASIIGELPRAVDGTPVECLQGPFGVMLGGSDIPVSPGKGGLRLGAMDYAVDQMALKLLGGISDSGTDESLLLVGAHEWPIGHDYVGLVKAGTDAEAFVDFAGLLLDGLSDLERGEGGLLKGGVDVEVGVDVAGLRKGGFTL